MIPTGASTANYQPTMQQIADFEDSSLYFSIGIPSESTNIMPIIKDVSVVSLVEKVEAEYSQVNFNNGTRDPHMCLSPKRVIVMIRAICEELSRIDPLNKETYEQNSQSYIIQLEELDKKIQNSLKDAGNKFFYSISSGFWLFS